jgi:hypothetical protein
VTAATPARIGAALAGLLGIGVLAGLVLNSAPEGPRTAAGSRQPAARQTGALLRLCDGWGNARRDCAAFVAHHLADLPQNNPAAPICTLPPARLADWAAAILKAPAAENPDGPWAPVVEAALATHPLPCPHPEAPST